MTTLGQLCLLGAFVSSGYASFACIVGWQRRNPSVLRSGVVAAVAGVLALTAVMGILVWALLVKDFRFAYVAQYSSRLLPWHYSLSALWVGQAGSLLLWAWFSGVLAIAFRFWPGREHSRLREPAFGILMAYLTFLVAIMVFAADPMRASLSTPREGIGLSPLLQHPAMLIHPPIVFLGYAGWSIPFALAVTAVASGRLDADWTRQARPWALFAWAVLGGGILFGAEWAYEELGWGGYWSWDPVENGSLIPWLTGTALIHSMMAWRSRGVLKKTAVLLAIATFGLCNFATFLTRSGIFSSVHAFSESPIGWMFLVLTVALVLGGTILVVLRRRGLSPKGPIPSVWGREALVLLATISLLLLAAVTFVGTLAVPLSDIVLGQKIVVGQAFYNNVLIPTGLVLLAATAAAPLSRWGKSPTSKQKKAIVASAGAGVIGAVLAFALGVRHPIGLAVAWLAVAAVFATAGALILDARQRDPDRLWPGLYKALRNNSRRYAGFLIHMGFVCLAIGVCGSSLGTHRHEVVMREGETIEWSGRSIHLVRLIQRELPGKLVAEAQLDISQNGVPLATLLPAQHLHLLQNEWTTEVAVHSTWSEDFYTILHGSGAEDSVSMTFVENPMMRWLWLGGWLLGAGALVGLWPGKRSSAEQSETPVSEQATRSKQRRMAAAALLLVGLH